MRADDRDVALYWLARGLIVIALGVAAFFFGDDSWTGAKRATLSVAAVGLGATGVLAYFEWRRKATFAEGWSSAVLGCTLILIGVSTLTLWGDPRIGRLVVGALYIVSGVAVFVFRWFKLRKP